MTGKFSDQWEGGHVLVSVRLFVVTAKQRELADSLRKGRNPVCFARSVTWTRGGYALGGDRAGTGEMGAFSFVSLFYWLVYKLKRFPSEVIWGLRVDVIGDGEDFCI